MSSILDDVAPDTAEKLAAQARIRGLSVDEYLRSLLPDEYDQPESKELSPSEKATLWRKNIENHSIEGVIADDGRESIYTREDDTL